MHMEKTESDIDNINQQISNRKAKLNEFMGMGINPYAGSFKVTVLFNQLFEKYNDISSEELDNLTDEYVTAGRIITRRGHGKTTFMNMQDSSGRLQVYVRRDDIGEDSYSVFKRFDIGDIIGVRGNVFKTRTGELTLRAKEVTLLTKSLRPLPEKWHGLKDVEIRYRQRYVDLIVNPDVKRIFKVRSSVIKQIRDFLNDRGYIEVETPMMHPIAGGATARPFMTHHNALDMDMFLRVAPELYLKRLVVGGIERIFEINRSFRNEGISTQHNPEFTMVEFYTAYADYNDLIGITEEMICRIVEETTGSKLLEYSGQHIDFNAPWARYSFNEALIELGKIDPNILTDRDRLAEYLNNLNVPISKGDDKANLLDKIFGITVEPKLIHPTFIVDYPIELSPLSKRRNDNPELVERFELYIAGREIANAYTELNDPIDQRKRFEEQVIKRGEGDEEAHLMDEDFIRALEYGMPPTAGEGIGIDRFVMLLTDSQSIRDVILFPHMRRE